MAAVLPDPASPVNLSPLAVVDLYKTVNPMPWSVQPYGKFEIDVVLKLYSERRLLRESGESPVVTNGKYLALSGGNPLKLFKLATLPRSPGHAVPQKSA